MTEENRQPEEAPGRFHDLEELQGEIARRIRDNQRFLDRFMDEDFPEEDEIEGDGEEEVFEEL